MGKEKTISRRDFITLGASALAGLASGAALITNPRRAGRKKPYLEGILEPTKLPYPAGGEQLNDSKYVALINDLYKYVKSNGRPYSYGLELPPIEEKDFDKDGKNDKVSVSISSLAPVFCIDFYLTKEGRKSPIIRGDIKNNTEVQNITFKDATEAEIKEYVGILHKELIKK
jgi:hypothetical protein